MGKILRVLIAPSQPRLLRRGCARAAMYGAAMTPAQHADTRAAERAPSGRLENLALALLLIARKVS